MHVDHQDQSHEASHGQLLAVTLHVRSTDSLHANAPRFDESAVDEAALEVLQTRKRACRLAASYVYAVLLHVVREDWLVDAELDGPVLAGCVETRAVFPHRRGCSAERVQHCWDWLRQDS